ncbi:hypothetical protein GN958_ATG11927 [Phytophthora infestans]|uniref:Uncharacterized protein n=1 Tax=Phytophthora infestans TaxID=4787 RepID=A0A8S9UEA4_PHYIN|nr:hypothetical protein GN958_ATG11927 [Phytophthora infestans]
MLFTLTSAYTFVHMALLALTLLFAALIQHAILSRQFARQLRVVFMSPTRAGATQDADDASSEITTALAAQLDAAIGASSTSTLPEYHRMLLEAVARYFNRGHTARVASDVSQSTPRLSITEPRLANNLGLTEISTNERTNASPAPIPPKQTAARAKRENIEKKRRTEKNACSFAGVALVSDRATAEYADEDEDKMPVPPAAASNPTIGPLPVGRRAFVYNYCSRAASAAAQPNAATSIAPVLVGCRAATPVALMQSSGIVCAV